MKELRGKVAVVTGAAGGIGRCLVRELAEAGMDVALADIDEAGMAAAKADVEARGRRAIAVRADVQHKAAFEALLATTVRELGACHVLINNAGVFHAGTVLESPDEQWERVLTVNLWGVIHGSRIFARHFVAQGDGHIVNVASAAGLFGAPGMTSYSTSKYGVVGFSEVLRWEIAKSGVGVTVVCPGIVRTGIAKAHGVGLEHVDIDELLRFAPNPEPLARKVVKGIRKNTPRVLYGVESYLFIALRFLPYALADMFGKLVAKNALEVVVRPKGD